MGDSHTIPIGATVRATHGPVTDPTDRDGTVVDYHDWWVRVKMKRSGIVMPFLEGELDVVGFNGDSDTPGVSD